MKLDDRFYFQWALSLARVSVKNGFSPVGAVLVTSIGETFVASSQREIGNILHAEYLAMAQYSQSDEYILLNETVSVNLFVSPFSGSRSTLYSTLEPCIFCGGMAVVLKIKHIKWLVDDVWAGVSRTLNYNSQYVKNRFPTLDKVDLPDLHQDAQNMWVEYLETTGHSDAIGYMLGLKGDQCK